MQTPLFANALSTDSSSARAEREALRVLGAGLAGREPDLLLVFVTHHHGSALEQLGPRLRQATGARVVLGCTGESIIGGGREVEHEPALSLWGACLPGCDVRFFEAGAEPGPGDTVLYSGWPTLGAPARTSLVLLGEPYSFPMDQYLKELNERFPGVPAVGGMSSGGMGPGQNLLITHAGLREGGLVGVAIEGDIEVRTVVSQGCRPIGKPWVVTACKQNLVQKLAGQSSLDVLMQTWQALPAGDQELFRGAPFVGLAIDANKHSFERGDFLVRGIVGFSQEERAFAVADAVRRGQTIQFLVRDAASAGEDLRALLQAGGERIGAGSSERLGSTNSAGALIFSCNGRGSRMFKTPDHDITCLRAGLQCELPVAGFFAAGEIGPVGGRNFLHGFTASVVIFRQREKNAGGART